MVSPNPSKSTANIAYLVIRDGKKWSDVFRLIPGRTVTIGRSADSQIVIRDEQASRHHAEVFFSGGRWILRDLGSRNGTKIGDSVISTDYKLNPGDIVWISNTQLAFVDDLSAAYSKQMLSKLEGVGSSGTATLPGGDEVTVCLAQPELISEPTNIVQRAQRARFLRHDMDIDRDEEESPKVNVDATRLCRLAFELANETTPRAIARMALDCLIEGTSVDAGAVLMIPAYRRTTTDPEKLEILASHSENRPEYQRVSQFLAETVINSGEAVLAREVKDDSALGLRDESGRVHATGVIAAPIRINNRIIGLVHLYSTKTDDLLDSEDLDFTLAVAETVGMALRTRYREQKLVEDLSKTRSEIDLLRSQLGVDSEIVGSSPAMFRVHEEVSRAAPSKATVLVRGESGVGKELVARSVHFSSPRKNGPFVCLNCAALSESLLESELFGHEKGAFTGATDRKMGKFEAADKGTLMLDEIGEMSLSIQAKFLRVLEGHPFERVGGSKAIKTDVRVIAATNRDLEADVRKGTFRKDLFFRLHVIQIEVPPLRHRPEDILELSDFFLNKFVGETGRKINGYTPQARNMLQRYRWPGNVRELKNVVERAVVLARGNEIQVDDLLLTNLAASSESRLELELDSFRFHPATLEEVEHQHIQRTLEATDWNKSKSAQILGIERSTLDRKIKKYGIDKA